jgi:glutamyl-tRNA synthetase
MSPSGGKLSKRKAEADGISINTKDYKENHYEPEALINFLAFLGWSPGDDSEIHSMTELCNLFTLDRVSKGGAVFNHKKLLWFNENYLREQSDREITERVKKITDDSVIQQADDQFLESAVQLLRDRVSKIDELITMGRFFFYDPEVYDENALKKWNTDSHNLVSLYQKNIESLTTAEFKADALKSNLEEVVNQQGVGFGKLMMPLRIAVTGLGFGPDLFTSMELLGKETVLRRIDIALKKLN